MKSCTPKLKCLVTKLARIADSTIDLTFLILIWEVIRITAGVLDQDLTLEIIIHACERPRQICVLNDDI